MEIEEQLFGRRKNKSSKVNTTIVDSGGYRRKFDEITDNKELSRLLYKLAKKMLYHRSGSLKEDMYWIDPKTIKVVAEETTQLLDKKIKYSEATKKTLKKYTNLITMHTHPNSFPPSVEDFNSNAENNYAVGLIICHNGRIFLYSSETVIDKRYFNLVVEKYLKQNYTETEAQILAIEEFCKNKNNFNIIFQEV